MLALIRLVWNNVHFFIVFILFALHFRLVDLCLDRNRRHPMRILAAAAINMQLRRDALLLVLFSGTLLI